LLQTDTSGKNKKIQKINRNQARKKLTGTAVYVIVARRDEI
jgi:hypothetical protein